MKASATRVITAVVTGALTTASFLTASQVFHGTTQTVVLAVTAGVNAIGAVYGVYFVVPASRGLVTESGDATANH